MTEQVSDTESTVPSPSDSDIDPETDEVTSNTGKRKLKQIFETFKQNRLALLGLVTLVVLLLLSILAEFIAPHDPNSQNFDAILAPPSLQHPLGTDELGRDIFSRILVAYQNLFTITISGVTGAFLIGTSIGLVAGYYGRWLDEGLMRAIDVLMSFPSLILALALIAAIGPSRVGIAIVLAIAYTPIFARVARGESVSLKQEPFIKSLKVKGASDFRIISRHIFPNAIAPIIVALTLQLAFGILITATLSFLGVGLQPPRASLGVMLDEGVPLLDVAPWISLAAGFAIMLPVMAFNLIGDGLRDSLDPKRMNR